MNIDLIILISIIALWLIVLIIAGTLAFIYHRVHTPYQKDRQKYLKNWESIKNEWQKQKNIKPISIKFPLPKDENVFYFDHQNEVYLYDKKTREYRFLIKSEGQKPNLYQAYEQDFDYIPLKSNFRLGLKANQKPLFDADVYITNKRIIFSNTYEKTKIVLPIEKVVKAYLALIYTHKHHERGYIIQTQDEVYEIVSSHPEALLIINELLKIQN